MGMGQSDYLDCPDHRRRGVGHSTAEPHHFQVGWRARLATAFHPFLPQARLGGQSINVADDALSLDERQS